MNNKEEEQHSAGSHSLRHKAEVIIQIECVAMRVMN